MKKSLLSSVSLAALAASAITTAMSAELSNTADEIITPPPMWTNFYAGLNSGFAWGAATRQISESGFIGGGQFGFNYQLSDRVVIGGETDIQGTAMKSVTRSIGFLDEDPQSNPANLISMFGQPTSTSPALFGEAAGPAPHALFGEALKAAPQALFGEAVAVAPTMFGEAISTGMAGNVAATMLRAEALYGLKTPVVSNHLDYLGTIRTRAGYLITSSLLVYGTGGLGYGGAQLQRAFHTSSENTTVLGYVAGGGLEWLFSPNWSVKTEGLYYYLTNGELGSGYQGTIARAGISYHFQIPRNPFYKKDND